MSNVLLQATGGISTVSQAATVAMLDGPPDVLGERAAINRARRDAVVDRFDAMSGLSCHQPKDAFYCF